MDVLLVALLPYATVGVAYFFIVTGYQRWYFGWRLGTPTRGDLVGTVVVMAFAWPIRAAFDLRRWLQEPAPDPREKKALKKAS